LEREGHAAVSPSEVHASRLIFQLVNLTKRGSETCVALRCFVNMWLAHAYRRECLRPSLSERISSEQATELTPGHLGAQITLALSYHPPRNIDERWRQILGGPDAAHRL
jgi:hypothetical protein